MGPMHSKSSGRAARRVDRWLDTAWPHRLLALLSLAGFALLVWNLRSPIVEQDSTGASDARAYWAAGRRLLEGGILYADTAGEPFAFLYPPIAAQLIAPLSLMPLPVFAWGIRALELLCLRYVVGSWKLAGASMILCLPVVAEIEAGNINLLIAAALAAAIRGDNRWLALAAVPKFAALTAVPFAVVRDRRGLFIGAAVVGVALAASFVTVPELWRAYVPFVLQQPSVDWQWYNVGRLVPLPLRLIVAAVFSLIAIRRPIYMPVAVALAAPVVWFNSLSVLVAMVPAATVDRVPRASAPLD
jgi:Glycosyltransferase family 87